jgi:predicted transposase YbfD/YdcC
MSSSLLFYFRGLEDPRVPGLVTYPLDEMVLAAVSGVLSGMDDWESIQMFALERLEWLRTFLPYKRGIASVQTFRLVFRALDHAVFAECFMAWIKAMAGRVQGVVAIDGKTARGSKQEASGAGALHMLCAFAHEAGLVIGQRAVDAKSNEITAIPALLESLMVEGAVVTIDAMGTQKAIAEKIIERGADYVLALKGNQSALQEDVATFFAEGSTEVSWLKYEEIDAGHGRIEERKITATADVGWLQARHPWKNLTSIARVDASRTHKKTGEVTRESRLYISSLPPDPAPLLAATRQHWSIENTLFWSLDVTFRDDASRNREDHGAANLTTLKHIAFNLLKRNPLKKSLRQKRIKAALNNNYRAELINTS